MRFSKWFVAVTITLSIATSLHLAAQEKSPKKQAAAAPVTPVDEVVNTLFATRCFE